MEEFVQDLRRMLLWLLVSGAFGACSCYPRAASWGCIAMAVLVILAVISAFQEGAQTVLKKAREDRERNLESLASDVMES